MEGLKIACRLMTEGFQQACLDVEVVVQKTLEDATANIQAFTAKAAQDLDCGPQHYGQFWTATGFQPPKWRRDVTIPGKPGRLLVTGSWVILRN